jgi:type II secretory pathway pseudopilin PulG
MDRTGIIVVTLCVVLLGFWFVGQQKYAQQQARYAATNQAAQAQSQFAATNPANTVSPAN